MGPDKTVASVGDADGASRAGRLDLELSAHCRTTVGAYHVELVTDDAQLALQEGNDRATTLAQTQ